MSIATTKKENFIYSEFAMHDLHIEQVLHKTENRPFHVQSFINNISFPKTLKELEYFIDEHGCYNVEDILRETDTIWSAPRWAKIGDIVFFMHAKTAISHITRLRTQLYENKDSYNKARFSEMMQWVVRALELYKLYGGKIFAIAQVSGMPTYEQLDDSQDIFHWGSRIYAAMDNIFVLNNPIDISEFNSFITVSRQSGITAVSGKEYDRLKKIIESKNIIPAYFKKCDATPIPLSKINTTNWMTISNEFRRSFMMESQFRSYYVDYLLKSVGDRKTIYQESPCYKNNTPLSFVDNVIFIGGKYLPVEIKLSVNVQQNIIAQVRKYCETNKIIIDKKKGREIYPAEIYNNYCLIIDTDFIYLYSNKQNIIEKIYDLDALKTENNVTELKQIIINHIKI